MDFKKVLQKPLIAFNDMNPEMSSECVEIVTAAVDKYLVAENYEKASQVCKESLEKKFGPTWNVCVGEGFGYDVTFNSKHCLLVYYGKCGVLPAPVPLLPPRTYPCLAGGTFVFFSITVYNLRLTPSPFFCVRR
jgi:dynein light chain 4